MAENLAAYLHYTPLRMPDGQPADECIASLILNRPDAANAFSADMLMQLTSLLQELARRPGVRLLLVQGSGKHFSGGADLHWMKESAQLTYADNLAEAKKLGAVFEALSQLPMPTVAVVKGAVFGGAVGLVAACDYALAFDSAKFCLSEVKIGLLPAVILPYLTQKIPAAQLRRQVLTARLFTAQEALQFGLVQQLFTPTTAEQVLRAELELLLAASPEAHACYKRLQSALLHQQLAPGELTAKTIAEARASEAGQAGLQAFFQKINPPWVRHLAPHDSLLIP